MSLDLLTKDHISEIKNSIKNSKNKIRIVSPFIGLQTANMLAESIKNTNVDCILITRFYREDFLNNVSSLDGLKALKNSGCKMFALKNLHTKLFIFDDDVGILGSANFTMGGLKFNHELSLLIEDEDELIGKLSHYCNELLSGIKAKGDYEISLSKIENEINETDKLLKKRKDKNIKYTNITKFGAELSNDKEVLMPDILEEAIREEINSGFDNNVWLKFVGTGSNRYNVCDRYKPEILNSNGKMITSFPKNPRGMAKGDYIYLAALSWDKEGNASPMVFGRTRTKGFVPGQVVKEEDINQYHWMVNYPYYVEIYDLEILDIDIGDSIAHSRLIKELGSGLYPSTQGMKLTTAQLKTRHSQSSHIRITPNAKKYIDQLFDGIIEEKGLKRIKY